MKADLARRIIRGANPNANVIALLEVAQTTTLLANFATATSCSLPPAVRLLLGTRSWSCRCRTPIPTARCADRAATRSARRATRTIYLPGSGADTDRIFETEAQVTRLWITSARPEALRAL
jgi:hypothetical protein